MPSKKKKFIDKKNAVTFHLVHRSQKDPLQANDEASQHVLLPVSQNDLAKQKEEQRKYGIFYDDDYDYTQHLKDVNEVYDLAEVHTIRVFNEDTNLKLPSSVFASEVERDVGLLNQAVAIKGPQPDWDPDIVAALDEDFDFADPDNQLEDDFILEANCSEGEDEIRSGDGHSVDEENDVASDAADFSDNDFSDGDEYGDIKFMQEETKSRFTDYSISSSVIRRNEGLTLLDDRFEKLFEEYDESEIGALDHEEIDGNLQRGSHMLDHILDEFEKQQKQVTFKDVVEEGVGEQELKVASDESDDETDTEMMEIILEEPKDKWDCESILSTYSNAYNHPKVIEEPHKEKPLKLTKKLGIPDDSLPVRGLTKKQIEKGMRDKERIDHASTYRPRDETLEEKKSRKLAIKQERKERREEKKANKKMFAQEKSRQVKTIINLQNNLQGIKLS
ncbi:hypothetical protein ACJMK2_041707 [Sinanodonta woodiana]|uniref:Protein LTV1 homolog n=1 Tax=Sinanodonta woodiana TaxID=1069815 RepID=A0ABD3W501_SINWO